MAGKQKITPCLWFDSDGEEAAKFYVAVFGEGSEIVSVSRYGKEGYEIHGKPEGAVLTVEFTLRGQAFTALNGGPHFKFSEAVSMQIDCKDQQEVDYFWERLTADGGEESMCGWLKDRFGFSWQVVPARLTQLLNDPDREKAGRAMSAMLQMKKIDIAAIEKAFAG